MNESIEREKCEFSGGTSPDTADCSSERLHLPCRVREDAQCPAESRRIFPDVHSSTVMCYSSETMQRKATRDDDKNYDKFRHFFFYHTNRTRLENAFEQRFAFGCRPRSSSVQVKVIFYGTETSVCHISIIGATRSSMLVKYKWSKFVVLSSVQPPAPTNGGGRQRLETSTLRCSGHLSKHPACDGRRYSYQL